MTTSTTASCQSAAGVGTVLSGPCSSPIALSSAFGLRTNQGAVAIGVPLQALALGGHQVVDRLLQRVGVPEAGEIAQAVEAGPAPADVLEVLAVGLAQGHVADARA